MNESLSEELKNKLFGYKKGRFPANIYNVYMVMLFYQSQFGTVTKDKSDRFVCLRPGSMCRFVGKIIGPIEHARIKFEAYLLLGCEPSTATVKGVIILLADDYAQQNPTNSRFLDYKRKSDA